MAGYRLRQSGSQVQADLDKIESINIENGTITVGETSITPVVVEVDPTVPAWAKTPTKPVYTASEVGALPATTFIPTALSDLTADSTHRTVTDAEKEYWNSGATAYQKPDTGIPKSDLSYQVRQSLDLADTALQSFTETDPTVPAWAKALTKPSYSYTEISGTPVPFTDTELQNYINAAFAGI